MRQIFVARLQIIDREVINLKKNYKALDKGRWNGRIDSHDDFTCFRWHQKIIKVDLKDKNLDPFQGNLGFAFLGYPCEKGIIKNKGRTGAALGPDRIRERLSNLPWHFPQDVFIFDAGDISGRDSILEETQNSLSQAVERILSLNLFPILLGGGHDIAYGHYRGVFNHIKDRGRGEKIGIINFDAHFDLRSYSEGPSSGTMFKQIASHATNNGTNYSYLCLGILKQCNTAHLFNTADRLGVEYILAENMKSCDLLPSLQTIDNFIKRHDYIYITVCADVFSSAYAPGVSAPQPFGLAPEKVLIFLEHILQSQKVISFDIAEISPKLDVNGITSNLAANVIFSLVDTIVHL